MAVERDSMDTPTVSEATQHDHVDWTFGVHDCGSLEGARGAPSTCSNPTHLCYPVQKTKHLPDDVRLRLAEVLGRSVGGEKPGRYIAPAYGAADYAYPAGTGTPPWSTTLHRHMHRSVGGSAAAREGSPPSGNPRDDTQLLG